jgi:hypothetical protein
MAEAAGIYQALWRPEELHGGEIKAKEIIDIIEKGLADLEVRPDYYRQFNSPDGWGIYEHFVKFVSEYLMACKENPEATVKVSR